MLITQSSLVPKFFWKHFPVFYALPFIIATVQFEPLAKVGTVLRWAVLFVGCAIATNSGFRRAGHQGKILTSVDRAIILFLLLFLASEIWTVQPWITVQKAISVTFLYGCTFWTLWEYADCFSERLLIRKFLQTLGIILAVNLPLILFGNSWLIGRFRGFFENPNNIGLILSLAIPLTVAQWLSTRQKLYLAILSIFILNLFACGSRSAILSSGIAIVIIFISFFAKRPYQAIAISGFAILGLALFVQTDFFIYNVLREDSLATGSNRIYFWELAKTYIAKQPNIGHGFGADIEIHEHYGTLLTKLGLRGHGVMSSYYGLAIQIGWPFTYCFFSLLWGFVIYYFVKFWRNFELVTMISTLASGLIICIFEPAIYSAGNVFSFLFWMILMLAVRRRCYERWGLLFWI